MPTFIYESDSDTGDIRYFRGKFHYLTIVLSNCALSGNVFLSNVDDLEADIQTEFEKITNLEFRGVGCSMVRGDTDSLTLGISAGYYDEKANLTESEALSLRVAANQAIANIDNFTVSEVRVESTLLQESTY